MLLVIVNMQQELVYSSSSEVGEEYIYYYIAGDVTIENNIEIKTANIENRKYKEKITNTDDVYKTKNYKNINRKLKLMSNTNSNVDVAIPSGTEICMVTNGE